MLTICQSIAVFVILFRFFIATYINFEGAYVSLSPKEGFKLYIHNLWDIAIAIICIVAIVL